MLLRITVTLFVISGKPIKVATSSLKRSGVAVQSKEYWGSFCQSKKMIGSNRWMIYDCSFVIDKSTKDWTIDCQIQPMPSDKLEKTEQSNLAPNVKI